MIEKYDDCVLIIYDSDIYPTGVFNCYYQGLVVNSDGVVGVHVSLALSDDAVHYNLFLDGNTRFNLVRL